MNRFLTAFQVRMKNHLEMLSDLGASVSPSLEAIYVYDLGEVRRLYKKWTQLFPGITPYYAMKCNPNRNVIRTLAQCGAGFDCASPSEMAQVIEQGVRPERIIYANPCKKESDIAFMKNSGVNLTTFDSACEINKLARVYPECRLVLRIFSSDPHAKCVLSNKYGALPSEWDALLEIARDKNMKVVGVSFHIGSGASNPAAYAEAIRLTRQAADLGMRYGHDIRLIDIGGGFTTTNVTDMSAEVRRSLGAAFTPDMGQFTVIAEPGRFFAETVASLYTKVIGIRERAPRHDYYVAESIYGSFNNKLYDGARPEPIALHVRDPEDIVPCTIFGSTCDGIDIIARDVSMPRLQYGDWIRWDNMGAYTLSGATDFNGINYTIPKITYFDDEDNDE